MRLHKIQISNYKGFESINLELNPHFSVLIGDNGTGKTSILDACAIAIGSFFLGIDNTSTKGISMEEIRSKIIDGQPRYQLPLKIKAKGIVNKKEIEWIRTVRKISKRTTLTYKKATNIKKIAEELLEKSRKYGGENLPVIAYHGTGRLWAHHESPKYFTQTEGIEAGYKNCLSAKSDSKAFLSWYKTYEDEVQKFNRTQDKVLLAAFKKAITSLVTQWTDMAYSHKVDDLIGTFTDDKGMKNELAYSQLSDGYRNAIGMVADIAYRCIQLNPHLKEKVIEASEGIVLIDEIDLHLHPNWQRRIVEDLKRVFPNLQFIATTHSPFIVQSLRKGELINLDQLHENQEEPYKKSIEDVSEEIMNVQNIPRSKRFTEMLSVAEEYYNLIEENNDSNTQRISELREKLNLLEERYSDDPAYVALLRAERKSKNL